MTRSMRNAVYLELFLRAPEGAVLSSTDIADVTGWNASQIRRDLSTFGWCGKRGVGYNAKRMAEILSPVVAVDADAIRDEMRRIRENSDVGYALACATFREPRP